jgi:hypothetical protein
MARATKKRISSLSFSLNRFYGRISTAKPSTLIVSILAIAFTVFLFGGGLYDLAVKPLAAYYSSGRFIFLYPQLSEQFIADSMVATILYSFGIIGLVVIYESTKHAYNPRQAYMMLIVGIILLMIAYIFLEATIQLKVNG